MKQWSSYMLCVALVMGGCDESRTAPPAPMVDATPEPVAWAAPANIEPLLTPDPFGAMDIGGTRRLPECWETLLTPQGAAADPFPFSDPTERRYHLASCAPEAIARLADGALVVAFGGQPKPETGERDLHVAVWERDSGKLRYARRVDRSRQAANWTANFRSSFITELPSSKLCAGSLWEGDTQVLCINASDGQPIWDGSLPFWSGIAPQSAQDGLVVADLSAITKRYPFDGAEMRHRKLEGLGGRAGYYATDGKRLFFAPSRVDAPPLLAYDLETFDELWRIALPAPPSTAVMAVHADADRVILMMEGKLFGVDGTKGTIAWAYDIGEDPPKVASDEAALYVLSRRAELPNRLTALNPVSGERLWSIDTPSGTLRVDVVDGALFIGSVRAVQIVTVPQPQNDADATD